VGPSGRIQKPLSSMPIKNSGFLAFIVIVKKLKH